MLVVRLLERSKHPESVRGDGNIYGFYELSLFKFPHLGEMKICYSPLSACVLCDRLNPFESERPSRRNTIKLTIKTALETTEDAQQRVKEVSQLVKRKL